MNTQKVWEWSCSKPEVKVWEWSCPKPGVKIWEWSCHKPGLKVWEWSCPKPGLKVWEWGCPKPGPKVWEWGCPKPGLKVWEWSCPKPGHLLKGGSTNSIRRWKQQYSNLTKNKTKTTDKKHSSALGLPGQSYVLYHMSCHNMTICHDMRFISEILNPFTAWKQAIMFGKLRVQLTDLSQVGI